MESKHTCNNSISLISNQLQQRKWTLATAESCTGGMIGSLITDTPGASTWFRGGIIAYHNDIKQSLLQVPLSTLDTYGAVSKETVHVMSQGVCSLLKSECSIAVSGIAGPDGGTKEKPVGLVYIGVCITNVIKTFKHIFVGDRYDIRKQTVFTSLNYLANLLKNEILPHDHYITI